ncbi:hypothetical protein GF380_00565 [Candidatus Uhrbacteria bacterium]|nr:hypothetical protein [Candidatus Uhrbacteria bacterium]
MSIHLADDYAEATDGHRLHRVFEQPATSLRGTYLVQDRSGRAGRGYLHKTKDKRAKLYSYKCSYPHTDRVINGVKKQDREEYTWNIEDLCARLAEFNEEYIGVGLGNRSINKSDEPSELTMFNCNRGFLLDIANMPVKGDLTIRFLDWRSPIVFEHKPFYALLMPSRPPQEVRNA